MKGLRRLGPRAGTLVSVKGFRILIQSLKIWNISHHQVLRNFNLLDLHKSSVTRRKMAPLLEALYLRPTCKLQHWKMPPAATRSCQKPEAENLPKTRVGKSSAYPQLLSGWGKRTPDIWMMTVWERGRPHNSWLIKPASMASEQSIGRWKKSQGEPERV